MMLPKMAIDGILNLASVKKTEPEIDEPETCPSNGNISGEHWRFCPQYGHELINEKCKLRCPRCRYFMSCSDFDFAN